MAERGVIATPWLRLMLGLFSIFVLFHSSAALLGSDRGQAGVIVGAIVVASTLAFEKVFFGQPLAAAARSLGLGRPRASGLIAATLVCLSLLLVVPLFVRAAGASVAFFPGWPWLVPGLFVQAGIAEEVLFRGFLFGRLRRGRSFTRAALVATAPFVAVHLIVFLSMPWPIALAAVLLSLVMSFPFAALFELGGGTIWGPALLHFVAQGTVKVVIVSTESGALFPLVWMAASALLPLPLLWMRARDARLDVVVPGPLSGR